MRSFPLQPTEMTPSGHRHFIHCVMKSLRREEKLLLEILVNVSNGFYVVYLFSLWRGTSIEN